MISPRIDFHVRRLRHVAIDALCPGRTFFVMMVIERIKTTRGMGVAGSAKLVPLVLELEIVRIVAIGAANPFVEHLALAKRAVLIHFVENLTIRVISVLHQQFRGEIIVKISPSGKPFLQDTTAGMASGTRFNFR